MSSFLTFPSLQEKEYKKMGEQLLQTAWQTLNSPDWKLEKKLDNGDMVQVQTVKGKKLFKLTGYVMISPRQLLEELFYKIEEVPAWNPTLTDCRIIQPIDQFTDISYQVSQSVSQVQAVNTGWSSGLCRGGRWSRVHQGLRQPPALGPHGGRRVRVCRGEYQASGHAAPTQESPGRERAGLLGHETGGGGGQHVSLPVVARHRPQGRPRPLEIFLDHKSRVQGWIPQSIIDKALSGAQLDYIAYIRKRAVSLGPGNNLNTSIASCEDILVNT